MSQVVLLIQKILAFLRFVVVIHMKKGRPEEALTYQTPGNDHQTRIMLALFVPGKRPSQLNTLQRPVGFWAEEPYSQPPLSIPGI